MRKGPALPALPARVGAEAVGRACHNPAEEGHLLRSVQWAGWVRKTVGMDGEQEQLAREVEEALVPHMHIYACEAEIPGVYLPSEVIALCERLVPFNQASRLRYSDDAHNLRKNITCGDCIRLHED